MTIEPEAKPKTVDAAGNVTVASLRKKVWRSLTPAVAYDAGISLEETAQFLRMTRTPDRATLHLLARRLGML